MTSTQTVGLDLGMVRDRLTAGESLAGVARELGLSWQKLHVLVGTKGTRGVRASARKPAIVGARHGQPTATRPLVQQFAPRVLDDLVGQEAAVSILRAFVASPYSAAMLLEGGTGVGKTSAALALAAGLGCDVAARELGGVTTVASGEQNADAVRAAFRNLWYCPMRGSGWKVLIVNEADRMSPAAETIWLDALENIPRRSVVVFTTNNPQKLSERFRDRCLTVHFTDDSAVLAPAAEALIGRVWRERTGRPAQCEVVSSLIREAIIDSRLSFRRLLQVAERRLLAGA